MNLDTLHRADELDGLTETELLDLYRRVRELLAERLSTAHGAESLEMFFARMAEVVETSAPVVRISAREREVLHFLAQDKSNAEISAALFISSATVKRHVQSVISKYGVHSRTAAVMAAIRDGTLTVD